MDPNAIHRQPDFDLPEPQGASQKEAPKQADSLPENYFSSEKEASKASELPVAAPAAPPFIDPSQSVPSAEPTTGLMADPVSGTTTPLIADDVDLIEKEWVNKAKTIVEKTRNDPHLQNRELNRVKADYIKKRYNKEIKIVEE